MALGLMILGEFEIWGSLRPGGMLSPAFSIKLCY